MNTVKLEIEIELPTLLPSKLAAMCHKYAAHHCYVSWHPLAKWPVMTSNCCNVKAQDWKDFLKGIKIS